VTTLCPTCRQADVLDEERTSLYQSRHAGFDPLASYFRASAQGCAECGGTGRRGDVSVFDFFHAAEPAPQLFYTASLLTKEQYALTLATQGLLTIDDALGVEVDQYSRLQHLLEASEQAFSTNYSALQQKLLELQTSNTVLQQRTEALISLEKLGSDLIRSVDLPDIGNSVCRYAHTLCGAGRAALYVQRPDDEVEVLAAGGWRESPVGIQLAASSVFGAQRHNHAASAEPVPISRWPPGIPPREPDVEGARLYLGMQVPLIAQERLVGMLYVYPTTKPRFNPGEVALLRTLANQAALAIQRAELVDDLRAKITQLETAQAELVKKERLERELELAQQVQESLLPGNFPDVHGYTFSARCVPARQVGGDFYDVFRLDEHHFGIVIADVSDKGMPAALFMALTRSVLLAEAEREPSPRATLENVNRLLLALAKSDMFVSVFYGVVDTRRNTLTYACAGHDRPLLLRGGTARPLDGQGIVLGQLQSSTLGLTEEQVTLQHDDRLVLYTDGLSDVQNTQGVMLGRDGLTRLLLNTAHLPAPELSQSIFAELNAYRGDAEQFDDMTMLIVQVG
jgi:serine phosphatase RsbU (regulator of sigma subunit)